MSEDILQVFRKSDVTKSGLINRAQFLSLLDRVGVRGSSMLLDLFPDPSTESVDYERFIHWLCDKWKPKPMHLIEPLLVPPLRGLLLPTKTASSENKPSLLDRRRKNRSQASQSICTNGDAPAITTKKVRQAPPAEDVVGMEPPEFEDFAKDPCKDGNGTPLQESIDELSDTLFGLPFSMSMAIPTVEDYPVIAYSNGFTKLTGYEHDEIIGHNCRFLLQGVPAEDIQIATRHESHRYCRAAQLRSLTTLSHTFLIQRNARKNGELFWNLFMLSLIPGPKRRTYVVGLQLDLGPELDLAQGTDIAEAVQPLRRNAEIVQYALFASVVQRGLGDLPCDASARVAGLAMGAADQVKEWIQRAEASSDMYEQWGTLPWAVWPVHSKLALLNGGATLLRLEPEQISTGAIAMSIFPVKKKPRECFFKLRIENVCSLEGDVSKGAWLPSIAFTELSPSSMDELGGPPPALETTARSVCLRGDGRAFVCSMESHPIHQELSNVGMDPLAAVREMDVPYVVTPGDVLECSWRAGVIEIQVNGDIISRVEDEAIPKPPNKIMVYGMIDCCHATCKVTLLA